MGNSQTKNQKQGRYKKQVHWKAAEHPGPPGKPELVPNIDATPDVVTIKWDKPKTDGGSTIIGYLVEHRRTGSPHWVRATPMLIAQPQVTLSGLEPGWRYQFRVSAQNIVGMSEPGEISEPLTVTLQRSVITAPKFMEELKDTSALENEMTEFVVHVMGQPPPKICWFKDGFEIFSSRRTRIITENGKSVLTIFQVALSDEGEIKCTATNRAGHASTKANVKIEAPPVIRLPRQYEDGLLFELDEIIRLKVSIAGRPQPLVFWSHNGESLQNDDSCEVITTDKSSTLKVGQAKREDRGEYQIRAVNKIGEDVSSFLVTVTDRPKPPNDVKVIMTLGRSVTLSWSEPEDDGGCKIGAYIVEYYRVGWGVWLKAATCRHLTTILNELIEGSEYKFRVKAESPYGVSEPSVETDVIFIPDPKRGLMSAPARSRSQPRDVVKNELPVAPKRRSASSTRKENGNSGIVIPDNVPTRPKRERIKSPPKTPENLSPKASRKETGINTNIFDRVSLAREIAYDIDMKKKSEPKEENRLGVQVDRAPSPNKKRNKSPNRLNSILSSILPGKKSPSPSKKSPSPTKKQKNESPPMEPPKPPSEIPVTVKMLEIRSERSDLYDRSPSPMERRLSIKASAESPEKSIGKVRSPSPSKLARVQEDSRRNSMRSSNRQNSLDNEEQGSSEFMLVLFPEHGDKYYQDPDGNSIFIELDDDDLIPPPMSLSAPELGAEPPIFEPIRTSVSSTELLYERSLARFRKAAEQEEAEKLKKADRKTDLNLNTEPKIKIIEDEATERRLSIPKIQINNKDHEDLLAIEKKASFKRRLSAGGASSINSQQYIWAKRRHSLRKDAGSIEENEREQQKTSLERSRNYNDKNKTPTPTKEESLTPYESLMERRKEMLARQRSQSEEKEEEEFAKVRQKMQEQKIEVKTKLKDLTIMKQESWEEDSEDSDFSEDERLKETIPPLIQADEQETYHPRMSAVVMSSKQDEPFEILNKPLPLPDPNLVPKPILKKYEDLKTSPEKPTRKSPSPNKEKLSPSPRPTPDRTRSRTPSPTIERALQQVTPILTTPVEKQIQKQAADAAKNKRNLIRRESEEENTVIIDYYGTIVKQFSLKKGQSQFSDSEESRPQSRTEDHKPTISALDVLAKYAKTVPQEEDEEDKVVKNILAQYNDDVKKEPPQILEKPKPVVSRRKASPSPHMRTPMISNDARRHPSPNRKPIELTERKPFPSRRPLELKASNEEQLERKPSPVRTRRTMEVSSPETKRKTSRTRSSSRTRASSKTRKVLDRQSTPSEHKEKLSRISPPKISPSSSARSVTPEQEQMQIEAEITVRSTIDYLMDLSMFSVACYLYFFKNPILAIPFLIISVYRQINDELAMKMPGWMKKKQ